MGLQDAGWLDEEMGGRRGAPEHKVGLLIRVLAEIREV